MLAPMKRVEVLMVLLALWIPVSASGSGFEFCDFESKIQSVHLVAENTYELIVDVVRASKAKKHGVDSYTDCTEYIGKPLEVTFKTSELPNIPTIGDTLLFSRSVIDGFGMDGSYAGTSINTHLRALRKVSPAPNER